MADKITLIMILHNHQPVGNFDWVFKNAAEDAYIPFLDFLERHPHIKTGIHTTGPLLEWFAENRPDYLERLASCVKTGQVEILGGAFYEPILSKLPDRDKHGQIEMMNGWIEERFDKKPEGFWVAERIWEPYFASIFGSGGLKYTTLDNTHFQYAGLRENDIWGSYMTEDQGIGVRVLPIDYNLRYLIPFHEPQKTIDYIGALKDRGVTAVTYGDDGEKFGVWPGTKKWVYEDGWLERFFTALEVNSHWIDVVLPGDYVGSTPPLGRVYLPTASYKEMSEWSLPVHSQVAFAEAEKSFKGDLRFDALKPFVRGGFWRNFLTKYPESYNMYRRMLMVSKAVDAARRKPEYAEAARELYQAQCNCGWWHGVFGGLYLNFLRRAIYEHLIKAERLIDKRKCRAQSVDYDGDGHDEIIIRNDSLNLIVAPQQGGAALELDHLPKAFNLFDTMTRRPEAYHLQIPEAESADSGDSSHASIHEGVRSKEADIRKYLHYDPYRRLNFIDHFLSSEENHEAFYTGAYDERGDFVNAPYEIVKVKTKLGPGVYLSRKGTVRTSTGDMPVHIHKQVLMPSKGSVFEVNYGLETDVDPSEVLFGVEMNLGLQSGYADDSFIRIPGRTLKDKHLASTGTEADVRKVVLTIGWMPFTVSITFSRAAELRRFPVETVSQSEGGVERTYQNTCLLPVWRPERNSEGRFDITITMEVTS